MGHIRSDEIEIDKLLWATIKVGVVQNARRVLFLSEMEALIELEEGKFVVAGRQHLPNKGFVVSGYGQQGFQKKVLRGLVRMGIVSSPAVVRHIAAVKERERLADRKFRIKQIRDDCIALGIPIPQEVEDEYTAT